MQLWIIEFELVLDFYLQFVVVFRCQGQCVHHLKWICGQINLNVSLDTHSFIYCLFFILKISYSLWGSLHNDFFPHLFFDIHFTTMIFIFIFCTLTWILVCILLLFLIFREREEPVCSLFIHQKLSSSSSCEMRKTCSKEGGEIRGKNCANKE